MSNLIPDAQRKVYQSAIDDMADTFGRDIVVWRSSGRIINSTGNQNIPYYIGFDGEKYLLEDASGTYILDELQQSGEEDYDAFSDRGIEDIIYIPEKKTFKARIKYIDKQEKEFGLALANTINNNRANTDVDLVQEFQLVRIKVNKEANDYIRDCERITIDDENFTSLTVPRPHGLFEPDYFTIYLRSRP